MGKKGMAAMTAVVVMGLCGSVTWAQEGEKLKIGMAMNEEIDFVSSLQTALEEKAEELGDVEFIITNANGSAEKQLSDVDSLITQSPDVIVLRTVDADAGISCVEAVKNAGIL